MPHNMDLPFCNATTKKNMSGSRKYFPPTQTYSQPKVARSIRKRTMFRSTRVTQKGLPRKEFLNKLKRSHAEEDISSGTTISNSIYEPGKKKRRRESYFFDSLRSDSTLKTIYKNPNFSTSLESVPNILPPMLGRWSFNTDVLWDNMHSNQHSFGSLYEQTSNKNFSEIDTNVVMVTGSDGINRQIFVQKAVLMHVRETEAKTKFSFTNCKENIQRISEETPSSLASSGDWNGSGTGFSHHVSSLKLLRVKSSRNCTNLRLKRSHSRKVLQMKSSSQADSLIMGHADHCCCTGDAATKSLAGSSIAVHVGYRYSARDTASQSHAGPSTTEHADHCCCTGDAATKSLAGSSITAQAVHCYSATDTASQSYAGPSTAAYADHCSCTGDAATKSHTGSSITAQADHRYSAGDTASQTQPIYKFEGTTPQAKSNILKQKIKIGDQPDLDENIPNVGLESNIAENKEKNNALTFLNPPALLPSEQPSNCTLSDVERKGSNSDVSCTFLVLVCALLSTMFNLI